MYKLKLALQIAYKDLWHYFLVTVILVLIALTCIASYLAYYNADEYTVYSKNLVGKGLYYQTISPKLTKDARDYLESIEEDVKAYGVGVETVSLNTGLSNVYYMNSQLFESITYKTSSGVKSFLAENGAIVTADFGLKVGDKVLLPMQKGNIEVVIGAVISENSPILTLTKGGNEMSVDYLFDMRRSDEFPAIIISSDIYNIAPFVGYGVLLDFGDCDTATKNDCLLRLSKYGFSDSVDNMYSRNIAKRNGFVKIFLPIIIIGVLFLSLLWIIILQYSYKKNRRWIEILYSIGWSNGRILTTFLCLSFIISVFFLIIATPVFTVTAVFLRKRGILFDAGVVSLILICEALIIVLCTAISGWYNNKKMFLTGD